MKAQLFFIYVYIVHNLGERENFGEFGEFKALAKVIPIKMYT